MLYHGHPSDPGQDYRLAIHFYGVGAVVGAKALLMLAPLEPRKPNAPPGTLTGLDTLAIPSPCGNCLSKVNDGVLGRILGQFRTPRRNHGLHTVPARPQTHIVQPLAHLQAGPELSQCPVVGEAGVAGVLQKQGLLLGSGFEGYPVRFQQGCLPPQRLQQCIGGKPGPTGIRCSCDCK